MSEGIVSKREVVELALATKETPYTPWQFAFTREARARLESHFGSPQKLQGILQPHILDLFPIVFDRKDADFAEDVFGVVWNKSVDKDIGVIDNCMLPEPTLSGYEFPDPDYVANIEGLNGAIAKEDPGHEMFRIFSIGFSLYERAWTLRGMENLMMDFMEHPDFVNELMGRIADFNLELVGRAVKMDIDGVYFGDDWGQQTGLQMGPAIWSEFIKPQLKRMYGAVKDAGKKVFIHSCGDVDELFDELTEIGLDCFNPFQPEVMDIYALLEKYGDVLI